MGKKKEPRTQYIRVKLDATFVVEQDATVPIDGLPFLSMATSIAEHLSDRGVRVRYIQSARRVVLRVDEEGQVSNER